MDAKTYISNIVNETINQIKEDKFRESIRPMIAEAVMEEKSGKIKVGALVQKLMDNPEFKQKAIDYLNNDSEFNGWADKLKGKTYSNLDNQADGSKRRTVTQRLKDKKIDYAPIAYELWPNMSEDAARSWFSKKVDGRGGESFTDEEVSKIYNLLNNVMTE
jgi:hypothetical protein